MEVRMSQNIVRLGAEELLGVEAAPGRCLVVFQGRVRVTQLDGPRDHSVSAGGSYPFERTGLALIEAAEPASLVVLGEANPAWDAIGYEAAWPNTEANWPIAATAKPLSGFDAVEPALARAAA